MKSKLDRLKFAQDLWLKLNPYRNCVNYYDADKILNNCGEILLPPMHAAKFHTFLHPCPTPNLKNKITSTD